MLPIDVPIGNWRFPTDHYDETRAPIYPNRNIHWGPSLPASIPLPPYLQTSIDAYNHWCRHAYDWNAVLDLLDNLEDQLAAAQGFQFRGNEAHTPEPPPHNPTAATGSLYCTEVLTDSAGRIRHGHYLRAVVFFQRIPRIRLVVSRVHNLLPSALIVKFCHGHYGQA